MRSSPDEGGVMPPVRPVILLVEDHQDTRQMYAEFLSVSFEVLPAADSNAALEILKQSRPDLMITDLSLPGMDGFELVSLIRKDPVLGRTPIICLSGYGGHAHEVRARAAGCDRILQKPCMPDALAEIALELLLAVRDRGMQS
jgi:two-component system, cell cycle response regulator DivK